MDNINTEHTITLEGLTDWEILEKYPPSTVCDEWSTCADYCDMHARDMNCGDCDMYWEIIEFIKSGELVL